MSFNLMLPPILGVVGLVIAFVIYTVMSRASDGEAKERSIAEQIHIGAMVFMHREYKLLLAFAAVLIVGILVSPLGTNTAIAFVAGAVSSATAGYLGMYAATKANVRTAVAANTEGAAGTQHCLLRRLNHGVVRSVIGPVRPRRPLLLFRW